MIMMIMMPPRLTGRLLGKSEPGAGSSSGASAARRGHPGCLHLGGAFTGQRPGRRWQHAGRGSCSPDTIPRGDQGRATSQGGSGLSAN